MNNDLRINVDELDQEWMMLPQIYGEYCEKTELVDIELRKAKMRYDMRRADVSKHIRENAKDYCAEYGVSTLTEGFITTLIDSDKELQQMQLDMLAMERNKRLLTTAVKGLEMKRDALKNLTNLFQAEYFSIPGVTRRIEEYKKTQDRFEGRDIRKEVKLRLRNSRKNQQGESNEN